MMIGEGHLALAYDTYLEIIIRKQIITAAVKPASGELTCLMTDFGARFKVLTPKRQGPTPKPGQTLSLIHSTDPRKLTSTVGGKELVFFLSIMSAFQQT